MIVIVAIILMLAAVIIHHPTHAVSSCDVHVTDATVAAGAVLKYTCPAASLPFATEQVATRYRVTSASSDVAVKVGMTSGDDCMTYATTYPELSCSGAIHDCNITGYTLAAADSAAGDWCLLIYGSSQPTSVTIDLEYGAATYAHQWHLYNTGQFGGTPGNDVNSTGAWSQAAYGAGVVIMITDDGIARTHIDLSERFVMDLSWNFATQTRDPLPTVTRDEHGSSCAGVAAAAMNNVCGHGVAPRSSIAGFLLFGGGEAGDVASYVRAMYHDEQSASDGRRVSINSNSWVADGCGPDGCIYSYMVPQVTSSIHQGADYGRNGRGVVYLFAASNEGNFGGDMNMHHYCKMAEVMCIAASDYNGRRIYYSNAGAGLFVNSPSRGTIDKAAGLFPGIITIQYSADSTTSCQGNFGGTSSATPLVAGIAALVLGVRPDLSWRDVQHILQRTADRNDPASPEWFQNGVGVWYSHHHGFGRVNAGKAVTLAQHWLRVGDVVGTSSDIMSVEQSIIDNAPMSPVTSTIKFAADTIDLPVTLEHVMAYVTINHSRPNDLRITLTSPAGTIAILARPQVTELAVVLTLYPLAARVFWGESATGVWTIAITDEIAGIAGVFTSWSMEVQGNSNSTSSHSSSSSTGGGGGGGISSSSSSGRSKSSSSSTGKNDASSRLVISHDQRAIILTLMAMLLFIMHVPIG